MKSRDNLQRSEVFEGMSKRKVMARVARLYRNRVRECRLRNMVAKQESLARMTGISRSTISALENNRLFLSSHYALLIAEALGCRLDDLYEKRSGGASPGERFGKVEGIPRGNAGV